jgi:predicted metal-dependent phosphoesterase TrpH
MESASLESPLRDYAFDLHVHSFHSPDAADAPEELIAAARRRGLQGIAITDHDTCGAHADLLASGLQRPDGAAVDGFLVLPGVEVSTADGHLLCLGATLPDLAGRPAAEVVAAIHARGGVAIPAHPYDRWRSGICEAVLDELPVDALEVFNAAVSSRSFNARSLAYATRRGLSQTAASDAHHASAVGVSRTIFSLETLSVASVLAAIRSGGRPEGTYLSRAEALKKHFGNFFRAANKRLSARPVPDTF